MPEKKPITEFLRKKLESIDQKLKMDFLIFPKRDFDKQMTCDGAIAESKCLIEPICRYLDILNAKYNTTDMMGCVYAKLTPEQVLKLAEESYIDIIVDDFDINVVGGNYGRKYVEYMRKKQDI